MKKSYDDIKELIKIIGGESGYDIDKYEPVDGGDINDALCIYSGNKKLFLKLNSSSSYPLMFRKEANGLNKLKNNSSITIPDVICSGVAEEHQYLLLQWMERGNARSDCMEKFGADLARMHQQKQLFFGFEENNYIGSLSQQNDNHDSWSSFYASCRILPLVKKLFNHSLFSKKDVENAELLCKKLKDLFPEELPSLLHGDLWSGNYMVGSDGYVVMYDPAVYYGHREMDIGMTKLFGGFDQRFYDAYNDTYLLQKGWKNRLPLTQLYPLLVHAILFGGHYIYNVRQILETYS